MMHRIMMILAIALLAAGGYYGYQRYMNRQNVEIQSCPSSGCGQYAKCEGGMCVANWE